MSPLSNQIIQALASPKSGIFEDLKAKISNRSATIGVVGLGYVGLPFAVQARRSGFPVCGFDLSEEKVQKVLNCDSYIGDVSNEELTECVEHGNFDATTDFSLLADCDIIVVAVPTPLTKNLVPDLRAIESATRSIANHLRPGQLVTLESTTYPGTTEEVMLPILAESGLAVEQDYFLAHSPERVDPGNHQFKTKNTTKIVGGVGPKSSEIASAFYSCAIEKIVTVSSARAAELVKVYENIFRSVNVALVNELAMLCDRMNLNVWEVLDAAFTKPFGIMPFYPGPGVGGHCIPLDPHYLEFKAREYNFSTRFVQLAGEINRGMPRFVVDKAIRILGQKGIALPKAKIMVLGVAYKKDIDDYRESPAMEVLRLLLDLDASVIYHDPHVPAIDDRGITMLGSPLTPNVVSDCDLVIIATQHTGVDYAMVRKFAPLVLDTRNAMGDMPADNIIPL
jgi:nucleotide sugar dehydrogenase